MKGYVKTSLPFISIDVDGNMIQEGKVVNQVSGNGVPYTRNIKDRIVKGYDNGTGYLQVKCSVDGEIYRKYLHTLVWETFNGDIPDGMEINHIDHNKYNCSLSNLELVTHKQNMIAMMEYYGRSKKQVQLVYPSKKHRKYDISEMCWLVYSLGWEGAAKFLEVCSGNAVKRIVDSHIPDASKIIRRFRPSATEKKMKRTISIDQDAVNYIRSVYIPKHRKYGSRALGRMYGVDHTAILRLINNQISP